MPGGPSGPPGLFLARRRAWQDTAPEPTTFRKRRDPAARGAVRRPLPADHRLGLPLPAPAAAFVAVRGRRPPRLLREDRIPGPRSRADAREGGRGGLRGRAAGRARLRALRREPLGGEPRAGPRGRRPAVGGVPLPGPRDLRAIPLVGAARPRAARTFRVARDLRLHGRAHGFRDARRPDAGGRAPAARRERPRPRDLGTALREGPQDPRRRPAPPECGRRGPFREPAAALHGPAREARAPGRRLLRRHRFLVRRRSGRAGGPPPPGLVVRPRRRHAGRVARKPGGPAERAPFRRGAVREAARVRGRLRRLHDPVRAHAADRGDQPREALRVPRHGQARRRAAPARARAFRGRHRALRHGGGVHRRARVPRPGRGRGGARGPAPPDRAGQHVAGAVRNAERPDRGPAASRARCRGARRPGPGRGRRDCGARPGDPPPRRRRARAEGRNRVPPRRGRRARADHRREGRASRRAGERDRSRGERARSRTRRVGGARPTPRSGARGARALGKIPPRAASEDRGSPANRRGQAHGAGDTALHRGIASAPALAGAPPSPGRARCPCRRARAARCGQRAVGPAHHRCPSDGARGSLRRHRLLDHRLGLPVPTPAAAGDPVREKRPPRLLSLDDAVSFARRPRLGPGAQGRAGGGAAAARAALARCLRGPARRRRRGRSRRVLRSPRGRSFHGRCGLLRADPVLGAARRAAPRALRLADRLRLHGRVDELPGIRVERPRARGKARPRRRRHDRVGRPPRGEVEGGGAAPHPRQERDGCRALPDTLRRQRGPRQGAPPGHRLLRSARLLGGRAAAREDRRAPPGGDHRARRRPVRRGSDSRRRAAERAPARPAPLRRDAAAPVELRRLHHSVPRQRHHRGHEPGQVLRVPVRRQARRRAGPARSCSRTPGSRISRAGTTSSWPSFPGRSRSPPTTRAGKRAAVSPRRTTGRTATRRSTRA